MFVNEVLATKGSDVVTIKPSATVTELLRVLAEHRIGAVVVSAAGGSVDGIISERDVVRALHSDGAGALSREVKDLMTADVRTCEPGDRVRDIARIMTDGRFRHLPVLEGGTLIGIVSIGDVVKKRIDELETEAGALMDYLTS